MFSISLMIENRILFLIFLFTVVHSLNCCLWTAAQSNGATTPTPFNVGVILDLDTWNGKLTNTCISVAVQDFYAANNHYQTRLVMHTRNSKDVVLGAAFAVDKFVGANLRGALGVKPYIPWSRDLDDFRIRVLRKINIESGTLGELNVFCLQAYDTMWALAMAAERVGTITNQSFPKPKKYKNLTGLLELGISELGSRLLKEILESNFKGKSGEISLVDGQLQPHIYQIINVVSQGENEIGFWIPRVGISRQAYVTSELKLHPIIWPGESLLKPKGWTIPANGKKLKIGYPVKHTSSEFVNVNVNNSSNGTVLSGYCIEVFKAVMEALPYGVPYEFVPFQVVDGENGGSYKDGVHEVAFFQNHDAVVGDITITAHRSLFVDFSFPYTTGGVVMVVLTKYNRSNNFLLIFEAFSRNVLFFLFFMIIYMTIFGVPFDHQIAQIYAIPWILLSAEYPFHQIKDIKKMSKVKVLITVVAYVVLLGILLQVLFEDNRHLTIVDVDVKDLVRSGEHVGYQKGSSMENVLKQLKFDQAQLKVYNSPEEYGEALEKGSQNGGVAAIFDETPYIKLFMEKYCGKYRRVGPVYQMKGFGFVFPRGSPLVSDVSRAISLVVGDEKMTQIETRWLGSERSCPDPADSISSITRSFGFAKISGLLVISIIMFVFSSLIQGKASITPRARPTNVPEHMQEVQPNVDPHQARLTNVPEHMQEVQPNVDLHQARPTNFPEHMQEIQPNVDPLQAHPISVAKQEQPMLAGSPTLLCNTIAPFGSPINVLLERLQEEQPMDTPLPHAYVLEKAKQEVQSYNNPTPNDHKKGWFSHSRKEKPIPIKRKKNTKQ